MIRRVPPDQHASDPRDQGRPHQTPSRFAERRSGAHRARWLATVDEAYAHMERLIDAAAASVRFETYLLRDSGPALWLRAALLRACERGVRVHVLIDAFGSEDLHADFLAPLREAGAQVAMFNPKRLLRLSFRNHRKLLTTDGAHAVVGGFNIGPEYAGDGVRWGWCDTGVYVGGPVVAQLEHSFDALFELAPFTARTIRSAMRKGRAAAASQPQCVRLLESGPTMARSVLRRALRRDLQVARDVAIASAYFLPSRTIRRLLYTVAGRAGRVRLLLAGKSDVPLAQLAAERLYRRFLQRGVHIHEYQPQILHAKLVIMDDVVHVGSCNLDRRSLHINYELLLRFEWPELAADAREWFEQALAHAAPVRLAEWHRGRGFWRRVLSQLAYLALARIDPLIARRRFRAIS
jgi:cardiolipin synthase A/B